MDLHVNRQLHVGPKKKTLLPLGSLCSQEKPSQGVLQPDEMRKC